MPFARPHLEAFEAPLRLQMVMRHLEECGINARVKKFMAPRAPEDALLRVHSPYLVDIVKLMSDFGHGEIGEAAYASPALYDVARLAAGGAVRAATLVVEGRTKHAFSIMRPPGHHASTSTAMGLCYFNNIAIAIRQVQSTGEGMRVSILDFDDHHGNGTAEIFYADPHVQYISIHEYDYQNPNSGHYAEIGYGEAKGTNINIPLVEASPDASYAAALTEIVEPAIREFAPDLIAVSAGFDAHFGDPVGNMDVDSSTYWRFGETIRRLAKEVGARGSFWVLEGGYNPFLLGLCVEASIRGLAGNDCPRLSDQIEREVRQEILAQNESVLQEVKSHLADCLAL